MVIPLTKVINLCIEQTTDTNKIEDLQQFSFRKGLSMDSGILTLAELIQEGFEKKCYI